MAESCDVPAKEHIEDAHSMQWSASGDSPHDKHIARTALSTAASTSDTISSNEEVHYYEEWELDSEVGGDKDYPSEHSEAVDTPRERMQQSSRSSTALSKKRNVSSPFESSRSSTACCERRDTLSTFESESEESQSDLYGEKDPGMQDSKHELDSARLSTTDNSARSELTEQYNDLPNFNQDESCVTCRSTEAPPEDDLLTQHEALLYTSAKPSSPRGSRSEKGGNAVPRSIQVFVRVRPLSTKNGEENPVVKLGDENNVLRVLSPCNNQANNCIVTECGFDKVFMDSSTQEDIFCAVEPGLRASLQGYNATIFAYGQTGTGKTHTIFGEDADTIPTNEELQLSPWRPAWGIIPRAVSFLLRQVDELKKQDVDVELQCSFMQIYNDRVFDLLTDRRRQRPLIIREQPAWEGGTNVVLQGLSSERISALDDALRILHRGRTNRSVRETEANSCSSRSHAIVQLNVFTERSLENGDKLIRKSRLNIVDLAGSEKWNTDLEMDDAHSQELKNINTSLSALGNCIAALSEAGRKHIPYRDSTLTRLLQDSFGGNTQACLIATISPSSRACEETIRTLQFADRARSIMQSVRVNETLTGTSELQIAKAQITKLRERLESEQRRRHQMRIKEQETAQKEFFEKLQAKEREIQKLSKDNAVYSRWREDDIKKIRELETRVKELEAQVSSKDTGKSTPLSERPRLCVANAEPGTKNDVKFSQQLQISNAPLLPAPTKSVHAKKPSFSNGASVRKDDINVQKPYKKILERYALDSEKSIRRSSEHQITGSQSQTVLTPTQRKENNQLNPASQSTNPDLFKKHDAKQQFDLKSFATEQRKVWGSNENRQLVGPDSPEGLPVTLKSPELFYSSPECIANLSTLNFPSLRPTQPVTATPSAFEKQKLAALSGWGSQSQLTQSSSQLRFQAPSSLMQSAVRTEPMTLKEMEADVQNQWKAFASTSHTLSATDLAKERSLPTNTGKYSPALSDSFDKSDVCEKHRLKGCVLCVVKDPRSSSMRAMKSSTEFSVNTIERLDRIKPADATRQGPCERHQLASCFLCGSSSNGVMASSSFTHSTATTSSNAKDPSSRDEEEKSAGEINRSAILVNDAKCATHSLANCVLCAGVKTMARKIPQASPTKKLFTGDNLSTWPALSNQSGHTEATYQENMMKFSPRFDPIPDHPPSSNSSAKTQSYAHLLRRHTINHDMLDTESANKSKVGVQLRPQFSSFDLHSKDTPELTSSPTTSQDSYNQSRYRFPGTLAEESSLSSASYFQSREMAIPLSPVRAATWQPPPMRPSIKGPAVESDYRKNYEAMIRDASSEATLAL